MVALLAACALILSTGCSSRTAYVIARQNAQYSLSATNKIALADPAQSREEDHLVRQSLLTELHRQGFDVVASDDSEFTLTCWIDESWDRAKKVVSNRDGFWADTGTVPGYYVTPATPPVFGPPGSTYVYRERTPGMQHVVEVPYSVKGIRLRLFSHDRAHPGRPETAWEGYIEGGDHVSEQRESILLRTLLNYFGKDFNGRAKLVQ